jgi:hypothetical protein
VSGILNLNFDMYLLRFFIFGLFLWALQACANIVPPAGGERDENPPLLIAETSTPNLQTRFVPQPIELAFNEWIILDDVFNQVLISPPLAKRPAFSIKKKSVIVTFDEGEVLLPNATYTINFGDAVKDLTEKNPAENLKFVFSTGDQIDSLFVTGTIREIATRKPLKDALFMLYAEAKDSVVYQERPFYFAKSNKEGAFRIDNIREGAFKAFVLLDDNLNYLFDNNSERIAFPDSLLVVSEGGKTGLLLEVFANEPKLRLLETRLPQPGLVQLLFNDIPQKATLEYADSAFSPIVAFDGDTLNFWYARFTDSLRHLYFLPPGENEHDTVVVDPVLTKPLPPLQMLRPSSRPIIQNPGKDLVLRFNHPIDTLDQTNWKLLRDTLGEAVTFSAVIDTLERRNVIIRFPWQENMSYVLEGLPQGCKDIFGQPNDTLSIPFFTGAFKDFGNIILKISDMLPEKNYRFELREKSGSLIEAFSVSGTETQEIQIRALPSGQYNLNFYEDTNRNGRWDTGNYGLAKQPERILLRELDQLRKNWDLEVTVAVESELQN